jgi:hypothetical protein
MLNFMHIYTEFYIVLYWNLCKFEMKFTHGDMQVYAEQFWSLHGEVRGMW